MTNTKIKFTTRTWREIAAEAAKETDPEKLHLLTAELIRALKEHYNALRVPSELPEETIAQKPAVRRDNPQA
jgi:hypothetical protein